MTEKHDYVCLRCGSDEVLAAGILSWQLAEQVWVVHQVLDDGSFCHRCGGATTLVERQLGSA